MTTDPIRTSDAKPSDRMIPAEQLQVYQEVQRIPPTRDSVRQIADSLDFSKLGALTVSQREDGTYSLIDGQRRVAALKHRGLGTYRVRCLVYQGLTVEQEAELFLGLNNTRVVHSLDRFAVGVTAGHAECLGINAVLKRIGWRVGRASGPGVAVSTEAMGKIWRADPSGAMLARVVGVLNEAFGRDRNTLSGHVVSGVGAFLAKNQVDDKQLIDKLRAKFASPLNLLSMARSRRETEGGSVASNIATVIARTYEARRKRA
jgi:hypothetical protein